MKDTTTRNVILGGIGLLGVLIIGGLVWAIMAGPDAKTGEANLSFNDVGDPTQGPADAKLTVHIFGDLQCPACRAAEPGVEYAMQKYANTVRFVWDDFPLVSVHPNARAAATAARCAEDQGKFWEYRSTLYTNQPDWADLGKPTDKFLGYAKDLGLDTTAFSACTSNDADAQKIQDDMAEGNSNSVQATPTFFVGKVRYEGGLTNDQWDQALAAQLPAS